MGMRASAPLSERVPEEWQAAHSALLAVTAATGAMLAAFDAATGTLPLVAVPTAVVLLGARLRAASSVVGAAGALIWLFLAPHAADEALVAPLVMVLAWTAVAVGPSRLWSWVRTEWTGREARGRGSETSAEATAWIEETSGVH